MNLDLPDFAVRGERGIDLFRRREDVVQRRARFVCLATVLPAGDEGDTAPGSRARAQALAQTPSHADGRLMLCHEPGARRIAAALWQAVARFEAAPLLHASLTLGDATSQPAAAPGTSSAALAGLFPYVEFLRERLLAETALARFETALGEGPHGPVRMDPAELATHLRLALDYNMIARGAALATPLSPLLRERARARDLPRALTEPTGYALRLLGDLCLRAGTVQAAAQALELFEAALALGENPFRRRRAIEAAAAAGQAEACRAHLRAWPDNQPLPDDLRFLGAATGATEEAAARMAATPASHGPTP